MVASIPFTKCLWYKPELFFLSFSLPLSFAHTHTHKIKTVTQWLCHKMSQPYSKMNTSTSHPDLALLLFHFATLAWPHPGISFLVIAKTSCLVCQWLLLTEINYICCFLINKMLDVKPLQHLFHTSVPLVLTAVLYV